MLAVEPAIEESWKRELKEEFQKDYFKKLKADLIKEKQSFTIYPPGQLIFSVFNHTPFHKVKVVIIGQDPYHGPGQAHGLSFSVPDGITPPPSLKNIFKEIYIDLGIPIPKSGNLEPWANQGVLLLNAFLTVRANEPGSHHKLGWEHFTNAAIEKLSEKKENIIFLLWGKFAQQKEELINTKKHYVLKAAHPSPLARTGFAGCKHFSKTNELLKKHGLGEIDWSLKSL